MAGDVGSIPRWGRSPTEGNGNPLHCSCLGNPMDRGAWQVVVGHDLATKQQLFYFIIILSQWLNLLFKNGMRIDIWQI